ncbi:MAG: glycosyltransferase family 2 protein [Magnetococcales bacterium]|nr:glycosyltransferase family 2 protein [Magnetococcales bacterium]
MNGSVKPSEVFLSVILPVYNEHQTIEPLVERLLPVLAQLGGTYEVIFINDGSTDGSDLIISSLVRQHQGRFKAVHFRINQGKSNALKTGFELATGTLVLMMDTDLQDQPEEIPKLLNHLHDRNLDVVTGWKFKRQDPLSKTLPSRLFNRTIRYFSKVEVQDFNCGLKLMRRECIQNLPLYGQLHRYILVLIAKRGYKIGEVAIEHAPRRFGHSKFGTGRMFTGFMDFLTVFFLTRYVQSPLYFFGIYSVLCMIFALLWGGYFIGSHLVNYFLGTVEVFMNLHPLWVLSPIMMVVSFMFLSIGLLGELIYFLHKGLEFNKPIRYSEGFADEGDRDDPPCRT